jgi:hypothetical protein
MRLWEDGFDHYGTDVANMLDGSYADAYHGGGTDDQVRLVATPVATGTNALYIRTAGPNSSSGGLRWVLPTTKDKLGAAGRFYFPNLPTVNTGAAIFDFLSSPTRSQLVCFVDSSGALRFYRGSYWGTNGNVGTLVAQTDPVLTAGAYNHVEVQVYIHDTDGWVRVAVNGVHRYSATSLDTKYDSSNVASIANHIPYYGNNGIIGDSDFYLDDLIYYDFTGTAATDTDFCPTVNGSGVATNYIANLQVWPLFTNGNTSEDDWGKSTGTSASALVNETTPDDGTYIYATAAGDLTELSLDDLPVNITYIRGLGIHGRLSQSDAGAAMIKLGMKSVAATSDAAERPLTVAPTYWRDAINVDPNSSARWTRASLNAAWVRLTRSA